MGATTCTTADVTREFLDTNVLVYAYDRSAGTKHAAAGALVERLVEGGTAAVSVQVLQELFVTVTRKLPRPLAVADARMLVADLGALAVHAPGADDVVAAIDLHARAQVSFWDGMILRSASAMGCEVLWSEDLGVGRRYDGVEVRDPFDPDTGA